MWPDGASFTGTFYLSAREGYGAMCLKERLFQVRGRPGRSWVRGVLMGSGFPSLSDCDRASNTEHEKKMNTQDERAGHCSVPGTGPGLPAIKCCVSCR